MHSKKIITPNKPDPTNGEEKMREWFQANYLDGDEIQDGQMLSSQEAFDALLASHLALLEQIIGENEDRKRFPEYIAGEEYVDDRDEKEIAFDNAFNEALDLINTDLRKKIEELKKQQP